MMPNNKAEFGFLKQGAKASLCCVNEAVSTKPACDWIWGTPFMSVAHPKYCSLQVNAFC
jgi:hypothetical protein